MTYSERPTLYCSFCSALIPDEQIKARHASNRKLIELAKAKRIFCSHACDVAQRQATGQAKRISEAGASGRRAFLARVRPHRRKK